MCYNSAQLATKIFKDAKHLGATSEELEVLKRKMEEAYKREYMNPLFHASGYAHPKMFAFDILKGNLDVNLHHWGLIPHWVKDEKTAKELWNHTINARGETIFEKPSFRDAAKNKRCIIPLQGFYEHFHYKNKTFPYFIKRKDDEDLMVGGLLSDWINKDTGEIISTMTIVTTEANSMMSKIHNNPKDKEPRMPLLLEFEDCKIWMEGSKEEVIGLIQPNKKIALEAHTVRRLSGKEYIGNVEEIQDVFEYEELKDKG